MAKTKIYTNLKRHIISLLVLIMLSVGLYAQTEIQGGDYWSFDTGVGMTDILVKGLSYQLVVDPKISISSPLMVGNRLSINYSTDEIFSLENQIYLRWNFLRLGYPEKPVNLFIQSGVGLLVSYRGGENGLFTDVTKNRGSFLVDAATGVTIPLSSTWHIEPAIRIGYPHIAGISITLGCKIPFRTEKDKYSSEKISLEKYSYEKYSSTTESVISESNAEQSNVDIDNGKQELNEPIFNDVANTESVMIGSYTEQSNVNIDSDTQKINEPIPNEIAYIDSVLFGADIEQYNVNIDNNTQEHNELVLNEIAKTLKKNPNYRVIIEGHANPFVSNPSKANGLLSFSKRRADTVVEQLKVRDVDEKQMLVIAFGGTRPISSNKNYSDKNRRVELIVFKDTVVDYAMINSNEEQYKANNKNVSLKQNEPVESVMFGADAGQYNVNIDSDTMKHNEHVISEIANTLKNHPDYRVRIEGYANPIINNPGKVGGLVSFSKMRADTVAEQLRVKGVDEKQMMVVAFGGAKPVTEDKSYCNKNRRVELVVFRDTVE
ncbi:MAG: OmpA family protein [Spirochaetes bacterium]|nr:OmpA family protein [Spirochaetota bacterium]